MLQGSPDHEAFASIDPGFRYSVVRLFSFRFGFLGFR
jgi:hypothetical protein